MTEPLDRVTILTRAGRALCRVDRWGARGVTDLSHDEIEAMALALVLLGPRPLGPGEVWVEPDPEDDENERIDRSIALASWPDDWPPRPADPVELEPDDEEHDDA